MESTLATLLAIKRAYKLPTIMPTKKGSEKETTTSTSPSPSTSQSASYHNKIPSASTSPTPAPFDLLVASSPPATSQPAAAVSSPSLSASTSASSVLPPAKSEPDSCCCDVCGKPHAVLLCATCVTSRYCSRECQGKDWPQHKIVCKESKKKKQQELEATAKKKERKLAEDKAAAITAVTNPPCACCGGVSFQECSGCGFVHYCDRACQMKHWPVHKILCRESPIYKANQELAAEKKKLVEEELALGVDNEQTLRTVMCIAHLLRC